MENQGGSHFIESLAQTIASTVRFNHSYDLSKARERQFLGLEFYLVSSQGLPGASRTHGWRVMGPLLPTRMAPTVLPAAAAHICWSLSTVLAVVFARWVIRVAPGTAR